MHCINVKCSSKCPLKCTRCSNIIICAYLCTKGDIIMLSIKDNKVMGTIVINTILDPITKSHPDGRHLIIKNFQIICDGVSINEIENKARGQIGIETRAKIRDWSDTAVRALNNTTVKWDEHFAKKARVIQRPMTDEEMVAALLAKHDGDVIAVMAMLKK